MVWLNVALVIGLVGLIAVAMRRVWISADSHSDPDIDVGTVSERWLAEQRGSGRGFHREP